MYFGRQGQYYHKWCIRSIVVVLQLCYDFTSAQARGEAQPFGCTSGLAPSRPLLAPLPVTPPSNWSQAPTGRGPTTSFDLCVSSSSRALTIACATTCWRGHTPFGGGGWGGKTPQPRTQQMFPCNSPIRSLLTLPSVPPHPPEWVTRSLPEPSHPAGVRIVPCPHPTPETDARSE